MSMLPLLFLPGLLCDGRLWHHQAAALADRAVPVIGDLRHHDRVGAMARHALEAVPPGPFALAGLSMGGYVAMEIMRQAPERVRGLALLDTTARPDAPEQAERRRALMRASSAGRFIGVTRHLLPTLIHPKRLQDDEPGATVIAMAKDIGREAFLRQQTAILERVDSRPSLGAITVPTLVVVGADDQLTPPDRAEEMATAIPGARLEVIPACGHLPTLEVPDVATALLRDWLSGLNG